MSDVLSAQARPREAPLAPTPSEVLRREVEALRGGDPAAAARLLGLLRSVGPRHEAAGDEATLLLAALDDTTLHGAEAPGGISLRTEAVEAVLRLGYPWALELTPDDMAALHPARRAPLPRRAWVAGALLALAGLAAAVALQPQPVVVQPVPMERPRPRPPATRVTPTPPELKTMLSAAELSSLVTQAQRALERRNDRTARSPLEQCLDADAKHLTCLRLLAEVEARQAAEQRDAAALSRARGLAERFLATAPADDAFRSRVEKVLTAELPPERAPRPR